MRQIFTIIISVLGTLVFSLSSLASEVTGTWMPGDSVRGDSVIVFSQNNKEIAREVVNYSYGGISEPFAIVTTRSGTIPDGIVKINTGSGLAYIPYKNNKRNGFVKISNEINGFKKEINYQDDKLNGVARMVAENGNIILEENYRDNKLDGVSKTFNPNNGELTMEFNYKRGKQEGVSKAYQEFGILAYQLNYKNGSKEGIETHYYRNGKVSSTISYKNNKPDGIRKEYDENGNILVEAMYRNGNQDGVTKVFYPGGGGIKLLSTLRDGKLINRKTYGIDGKLESDENF